MLAIASVTSATACYALGRRASGGRLRHPQVVGPAAPPWRSAPAKDGSAGLPAGAFGIRKSFPAAPPWRSAPPRRVGGPPGGRLRHSQVVGPAAPPWRSAPAKDGSAGLPAGAFGIRKSLVQRHLPGGRRLPRTGRRACRRAPSASASRWSSGTSLAVGACQGRVGGPPGGRLRHPGVFYSAARLAASPSSPSDRPRCRRCAPWGCTTPVAGPAVAVAVGIPWALRSANLAAGAALLRGGDRRSCDRPPAASCAARRSGPDRPRWRPRCRGGQARRQRRHRRSPGRHEPARSRWTR